MKYLCVCVCHIDPLKRHCEELSCMPCCVTCKKCTNHIVFGRMRAHMLELHGIELPPANPEKLKLFERLVNELGLLEEIEEKYGTQDND